MYFCGFIQTDYKAKQIFFIINLNKEAQGTIYTHKSVTQGTLCNVQNDNRSSPVEEYFQMFSEAIIKKFENAPSLVMTGHYFKHCFVLL